MRWLLALLGCGPPREARQQMPPVIACCAAPQGASETDTFAVHGPDQLDVLFLVDPAFGEAGAILASGLVPFFDSLGSQSVDWRLGVVSMAGGPLVAPVIDPLPRRARRGAHQRARRGLRRRSGAGARLRRGAGRCVVFP